MYDCIYILPCISNSRLFFRRMQVIFLQLKTYFALFMTFFHFYAGKLSSHKRHLSDFSFKSDERNKIFCLSKKAINVPAQYTHKQHDVNVVEFVVCKHFS